MKKIRVGLDISQLAHRGGVATYTKNLSEQLSKELDLEMVYFYSSLRKPYRGKLKNVKSYRLPPTFFETLFNKMRNVGIERFIGPIDIFHSSDWVQPPTKAKKVTTYHDVVPIKYPDWSHPKIVEVHKRRLEIVEREVDKVIAVSKATKQDLIECSKIPAGKIEVVYEGVDEVFKPQDKLAIREFKERYKLPEEFLLAIGGVGERRNLDRIKQVCKGYNLVVTGETVWVKDHELPLLYSSAAALIYPSLYEGFGLPILESMACETPVVTSNISAMAEVAGRAALLVDPKDLEQIGKAVRSVVNDKELIRELVKKGKARVGEFSWERCREQTIQVYKELIKD